MRTILMLAAMTILAGVYVLFVVRSSEQPYVSRDVSPDELRALIEPTVLLEGFEPINENSGRLRSPGIHDDMAFVEVLFMDPTGRRAAVSVVAIGSGEARTGLRFARDALCSKSWPAGDCDPQFNRYHYTGTEPAAEVGEKVLASTRDGDFGPVLNHTFSRAGMQITLSLQSDDVAVLDAAPEVLRALDARAISLASKRVAQGVNEARSNP